MSLQVNDNWHGKNSLEVKHSSIASPYQQYPVCRLLIWFLHVHITQLLLRKLGGAFLTSGLKIDLMSSIATGLLLVMLLPSTS